MKNTPKKQLRAQDWKQLKILQNTNQTKKWRDSKVIRKIIQDGDLLLRRRPNAKNVGKLQPKW